MDAEQIFIEGQFICPKCYSTAFREIWRRSDYGTDMLTGVECINCGAFYQARKSYWIGFHKPISKYDIWESIYD